MIILFLFSAHGDCIHLEWLLTKFLLRLPSTLALSFDSCWGLTIDWVEFDLLLRIHWPGVDNR